MSPERQKQLLKTKFGLAKASFIFGKLALAAAAITSACDGGEEPFQTPTPAVRPVATSSTPKLQPAPKETPTILPIPEIKEQLTQVFTTENLNLRSGPGLDFPVLGTKLRNTLGQVLEGPVESDSFWWWKIRYEDGTEGWSAQDWLKFGQSWPDVESCKLLRPANLKESTKFGIFGDDTFDTVVCGYLKVDTIVFEEQKITIPYLVIVKALDQGFIQSIDQGIQRGNTVNRKGSQYFEFNLGCLKDQQITGIEYQAGNQYMDQKTQTAILQSSPKDLVTVVVSFGKHGGAGCDCCNLAHQIHLLQ